MEVELLYEVDTDTNDWEGNSCERRCYGDEGHLSDAENEGCGDINTKSVDEVEDGKDGRHRGQCDLLAKVLRAATGNSISISMRSWLKRLSVTPVSVVEKKDMGDLYFVSMRGFINCDTSNIPKHRIQQLLVECDAGTRDHRNDELPSMGVSTGFSEQDRNACQQLSIRKNSAKPPSMA